MKKERERERERWRERGGVLNHTSKMENFAKIGSGWTMNTAIFDKKLRLRLLIGLWLYRQIFPIIIN